MAKLPITEHLSKMDLATATNLTESSTFLKETFKLDSNSTEEIYENINSEAELERAIHRIHELEQKLARMEQELSDKDRLLKQNDEEISFLISQNRNLNNDIFKEQSLTIAEKQKSHFLQKELHETEEKFKEYLNATQTKPNQISDDAPELKPNLNVRPTPSESEVIAIFTTIILHNDLNLSYMIVLWFSIIFNQMKVYKLLVDLTVFTFQSIQMLKDSQIPQETDQPSGSNSPTPSIDSGINLEVNFFESYLKDLLK